MPGREWHLDWGAGVKMMDMVLDSGYTVMVLSNTDQGCSRVFDFLAQQPFIP